MSIYTWQLQVIDIIKPYIIIFLWNMIQNDARIRGKIIEITAKWY